MPKFSITTLGCKVNQAESETIARDLLSANWSQTAGCGDAAVCIVNTCTVTRKASMQSRQAIRKAIRANPTARIVVTGCYAQTAPHEIRKIDGVDDVIEHDRKLAVGRMIRSTHDAAANRTTPRAETAKTALPLQTVSAATGSSRTRPYLKIQDGCNAFCTYCIVPYARGRSRSVPMADVLHSIEELNLAGFHEVVLTGIHLGVYGRDLTPAVRLIDLIHQIRDLADIHRVRLSSVEPLELTTEIIEALAASDKFCRHFHIPLQSGDDRILSNMGRPYTRQAFRDLVIKIRNIIPDAAIGADILVGFPGETDQAFQNTHDLVEELPVSYLHVFPYSVRPGTPAAEMPDPVAVDVIRNRCEKMRQLGWTKRRRFYRQSIGKVMTVVVESKRDRESGLLKGVSANYLPILFDGVDTLKNQLAEVKIVNLKENNIFGNFCALKHTPSRSGKA